MKLKISAIGKLKSGPERELFSRYLARSRRLGSHLGFSAISLQEFPESANRDSARRKRQEAEFLLSSAKKDAVIFAFDENGENLSSHQFSRALKKERDAGASELIFVLGGCDGLGAELLKKAKLTICFGYMTWPHQIARILLAEQLYRTMTILAAHPYHRV